MSSQQAHHSAVVETFLGSDGKRCVTMYVCWAMHGQEQRDMELMFGNRRGILLQTGFVWNASRRKS
jgi:hypothetical protein